MELLAPRQVGRPPKNPRFLAHPLQVKAPPPHQVCLDSQQPLLAPSLQLVGCSASPKPSQLSRPRPCLARLSHRVRQRRQAFLVRLPSQLPSSHLQVDCLVNPQRVRLNLACLAHRHKPLGLVLVLQLHPSLSSHPIFGVHPSSLRNNHLVLHLWLIRVAVSS